MTTSDKIYDVSLDRKSDKMKIKWDKAEPYPVGGGEGGESHFKNDGVARLIFEI